MDELHGKLTGEVRPSFDQDGWWDLVFRRGDTNYLATLQVPIQDRAKAERVLAMMLEELGPEYEEHSRLTDARHEQIRARMDEEHAARSKQAAKDAADRKARVTEDTERVELLICDSCGDELDPNDLDEPVYECSRCGQQTRGEDGRRCQTCNIFCAKVASHSCPNCEEPIDDVDGLTPVTGVVIDGTFIREEELTK